MRLPKIGKWLYPLLIIQLCSIAFSRATNAEDMVLEFKPALFEILENEWGCGSQCKDIITSRCIFPDYIEAESLLPENACYLQSFRNGRSIKHWIKPDWLSDDITFVLEWDQVNKICTHFEMLDYRIYHVESYNLISVIITRKDGKGIPSDQSKASELANKLFVNTLPEYEAVVNGEWVMKDEETLNFDFIKAGEIDGISYGYRPAYYEMALKKEERKVNREWVRTWFNDMLWWADGEKIGFITLSVDERRGSPSSMSKNKKVDFGGWFSRSRHKNRVGELDDCLKDKEADVVKKKEKNDGSSKDDNKPDDSQKPDDKTPTPEGLKKAGGNDEKSPDADKKTDRSPKPPSGGGSGDEKSQTVWIGAIAFIVLVMVLLFYVLYNRGRRNRE